MKSVLCLTVFVVFVTLINAAAVPQLEAEVEPKSAIYERLMAKIQAEFANKEIQQKAEEEHRLNGDLMNKMKAAFDNKVAVNPEVEQENLLNGDLLNRIKNEFVNKALHKKVEETPVSEPNVELMAKIQKEFADKAMQHKVDMVIKKMKIRKAIMDQAKAQKESFKFLCKPCKTVIADVRNELEAVEKITEPLLKEKIDEACKKYVGSIPFVEKSCDKIGETAIDDLLEWLEKEEDKLDPERTCMFMHVC